MKTTLNMSSVRSAHLDQTIKVYILPYIIGRRGDRTFLMIIGLAVASGIISDDQKVDKKKHLIEDLPVIFWELDNS